MVAHNTFWKNSLKKKKNIFRLSPFSFSIFSYVSSQLCRSSCALRRCQLLHVFSQRKQDFAKTQAVWLTLTDVRHNTERPSQQTEWNTQRRRLKKKKKGLLESSAASCFSSTNKFTRSQILYCFPREPLSLCNQKSHKTASRGCRRSLKSCFGKKKKTLGGNKVVSSDTIHGRVHVSHCAAFVPGGSLERPN